MSDVSTKGERNPYDEAKGFTLVPDRIARLKVCNGRLIDQSAKLLLCRLHRNFARRAKAPNNVLIEKANALKALAYDLGTTEKAIRRAREALELARLLFFVVGKNRFGGTAITEYTLMPIELIADDSAVVKRSVADRDFIAKRAAWIEKCQEAQAAKDREAERARRDRDAAEQEASWAALAADGDAGDNDFAGADADFDSLPWDGETPGGYCDSTGPGDDSTPECNGAQAEECDPIAGGLSNRARTNRARANRQSSDKRAESFEQKRSSDTRDGIGEEGIDQDNLAREPKKKRAEETDLDAARAVIDRAKKIAKSLGGGNTLKGQEV